MKTMIQMMAAKVKSIVKNKRVRKVKKLMKKMRKQQQDGRKKMMMISLGSQRAILKRKIRKKVKRRRKVEDILQRVMRN